ncbi:response regulator [Actinomycetospora sp. C-140]
MASITPTATKPLRVVVVDDHEVVVAGLKAMFAPFTERVRVVGSAQGVDEALEVIASQSPDVVLADVRLEGQSGLDLCRRLGEQTLVHRVVLLSVYDDEQYLFQALRAGASGYLLKHIHGEELVSQLELAADGTTVIDPRMAGRAVSSAARLNRDEFWPGAHLGLSHRESEVLALLVASCTNRAIAARLVVGEETVKTHVRAVLRKLGVGDRTAAVALALREGVFR